jgi:hypothetical protein
MRGPSSSSWSSVSQASREVHEPPRRPAPVSYRATFVWTLRNPGGAVTNRFTHKAGPVKLGC